MDGIPSFLFFLHDAVLPEDMLEPTSVPFSFDHGLPLNNNTEQTRSLPHRDKNIHTSASLDFWMMRLIDSGIDLLTCITLATHLASI